MSREEEPGLLGNLPRSRPGHRSEKRPAEAGEPRRSSPSRPPRPQQGHGQQDRVGDALRAAGKAAGAGLRVANGVTRELLRRLPRR